MYNCSDVDGYDTAKCCNRCHDLSVGYVMRAADIDNRAFLCCRSVMRYMDLHPDAAIVKDPDDDFTGVV